MQTSALKRNLFSCSYLFVIFFFISEFTYPKIFIPQTIKLNESWMLQSSGKLNVNGEVISSPNYSVNDWFKADVPSTVLGTLVKNNIYKDVFVGDNLKSIPAEQFEKSWWYRTEFTMPNSTNNRNVTLEFDGVIYRANVWLNGKQIASSDEMFGVYRRF